MFRALFNCGLQQLRTTIVLTNDCCFFGIQYKCSHGGRNAITFSVSCVNTMHNGLIEIWNFFARHGMSTSENEYADDNDDDHYDAEDDENHEHGKEIYISSSRKNINDQNEKK